MGTYSQFCLHYCVVVAVSNLWSWFAGLMFIVPVPNVCNTNRKTNIFRGRTGQLVEHQTEIPGAVLSWIQFPVGTKDFFSWDQLSVLTLFQCSHSPLCAAACISNHVHIKNPKHWQPYHCMDTQILHTQIGMGSAALAAAVPYPGMMTQIPRKGQWSTKNRKKKRATFDKFWTHRINLNNHKIALINQLHYSDNWVITSYFKSMN